MNRCITDDQAQLRVGLFKHGGDFGGEAFEQALVHGAGRVYGECDASAASRTSGAFKGYGFIIVAALLKTFLLLRVARLKALLDFLFELRQRTDLTRRDSPLASLVA